MKLSRTEKKCIIEISFNNWRDWMKKIYLGIALSHLMISSCSDVNIEKNNYNTSVFGGEIDTDPESPGSYSAVQVRAEGQSCTGTLISKRLVVTAAHCIQDALGNIPEIGVNFVTYKRDVGKDREIKAVDAKIHPLYTSSMNFIGDIAWIKLSRDAFSDYRPVPVLMNPYHLRHKDEVLLTGFGFYSMENDQFLSDAKRTAKTTFNRYYKGPLYNSFFATGPTEGVGPCYGDSGGPVYAKYNSEWVVMGVTNGPDPVYAEDLNCGISGFYRFIGDHIDWIESSSGIRVEKRGKYDSEPKEGTYFVKNWELVKGADLNIPDGGHVDVTLEVDQDYTKDRLNLFMNTSHPNPRDISVSLLDGNLDFHSYLLFGVRKNNRTGMQPFSDMDIVPAGKWVVRVSDTVKNGKSGVIKSMHFKLEALK